MIIEYYFDIECFSFIYFIFSLSIDNKNKSAIFQFETATTKNVRKKLFHCLSLENPWLTFRISHPHLHSRHFERIEFFVVENGIRSCVLILCFFRVKYLTHSGTMRTAGSHIYVGVYVYGWGCGFVRCGAYAEKGRRRLPNGPKWKHTEQWGYCHFIPVCVYAGVRMETVNVIQHLYTHWCASVVYPLNAFAHAFVLVCVPLSWKRKSEGTEPRKKNLK